ncbi:hypothetical protein Tco_0995541 [Tanacetum coccineum]
MHDDDEAHDDEHEEMNDDENADELKDDQVMNDAEKVDPKKTEEKNGDIEQVGDDKDKDDQVGSLVSMTLKEKPEVPPSSSSHSLLSNYKNQFLNLSSDTSLVGTVKEPADIEINYLLDVQIQQEIPSVLSSPLLDVQVFVIPEKTTTTRIPTPLTTPLPTPPIISEAPPVTTTKNPAFIAQSSSTPAQPSSKAAESLS